MYVYITYLTYYIVNQGCWFCLFNPLLQVLETVVLGPRSLVSGFEFLALGFPAPG